MQFQWKLKTCILLFGLIVSIAISVFAQHETTGKLSKGGEGVSGPYDVVPDWPQKLSSDVTWGRTSFVYAESPNRIFVIQSGMVPWTWKKLQGERLLGAQESGGTDLYSANGAMHCASTLPTAAAAASAGKP